ncbi:IS66 family insertion sequence element accessory protein TnpB [Sorangium sp. So ce1036]|uniref:IS66 family insertion sequence element accessory protein TnpB n=1 Tax=Sorangium sp. So ce1036 TaxID=3133328 RepID=UPI003F011A0D
MLTLPPSVRVYVAAEPTDLRKSFDGLSVLVSQRFGAGPLCGRVRPGVGLAREARRETLCGVTGRLAAQNGAFPVRWPSVGTACWNIGRLAERKPRRAAIRLRYQAR